MSAVMFAVFLGFSLVTAVQPNWPVTAYLSGHVLGVAWLARQLSSSRAWYRRLGVTALALGCMASLALTVIIHHSDLVRPVLLAMARLTSCRNQLPLRRTDPTCRLRGWHALAAEVDRIRQRLRREGTEPVLAAAGWTLPGELGFYCRNHPTVYSLGLALGDRHSQYDCWRPNPVMDDRDFLGSTMIVVGEPSPALLGAFDRVETVRTVNYEEQGQPIARWTILVCRRYRGFGHSDRREEW
jgi:hypothetical protein